MKRIKFLSKKERDVLNTTKEVARDFIKKTKIKYSQPSQSIAIEIIHKGDSLYNESIALIKADKNAVLRYYELQEAATWLYIEGNAVTRFYFMQQHQTESVIKNIQFLTDQEETLILRVAEIRDCIRKIKEHDGISADTTSQSNHMKK